MAQRDDVGVAPFFDPSTCPVCTVALPPRPLRCPACGVGLTGPTVAELVTTLRRADDLVGRMRAEAAVAVSSPAVHLPPQPRQPDRSTGPSLTGPSLTGPPPAGPSFTGPRPDGPPTGPVPARSWFAGRSVGVILLILGALCVLAAGVVFVAVAWLDLPLAVRALILVVITASFGLFAQLALQRGLQATAEAMSAIACGMFVLDLSAARRAGLPGLADLATAPYEIVAGALLVAVAGAAALAVRSQRHWLWTLDAVVAFGMARAAVGALPTGGDGVDLWSVTVVVAGSLLYLGWRRARFPVARWSALVLAAAGWVTAVMVGADRVADQVGTDPGHLATAWPAWVAALAAGLWSVRLTRLVWRRVAAVLCLAPLLLLLEIVAWHQGWVAAAVLLLAAYVVAALASGHVSGVWSPGVGLSAVLLGLSSVVGLLPTMVVLAARTGGMTPDQFDLSAVDVAPWLLPLTAAVVLGLVPRVTIGSYRLSLDHRDTAGVLLATLSVLPILYDAPFWVSFSVIFGVAVVLFCGARIWHRDGLLLLALSLLVILRVWAFQDDLAGPLAWTLIALACLGWALTESQVTVRAGFLAIAGLSALAGAAQWLVFLQVPVSFRGLVIVVLGSLGLVTSQGLVASQGLAASQSPPRGAVTRGVCEGLSVIWLVAGVSMAYGSPSHRAAELTVAGVAAGITAYLSQDRRLAGWVSGVLLTFASWIRLADSDIQAVEWYTVPAATALLVYGARRLRGDPGESSWRCLGPGLALALVPSLLVAVSDPVSWRGLVVGLAAVALVALGVRAGLAAPFALGAVATAVLALREIWPVAAFIPRWTLLFVIGGVLLAMGMTWEARARDVRSASRYVRGLR